jgi:dTDP-4-dehydrorhamnose reductase
VFDGNKKLVDEQCIPNSNVWYSKTKAYADDYITSYGYDNYLILRPRQMISAVASQTNMITKFMSYESISCHNEQNSITCTEDFGEMMEHLLKINATGVYNCVNDGTISPYEIAKMIRDRINPKMVVKNISYEKMLSLMPEKRVNVIMSTSKLKEAGFSPRPAKDAVTWCLNNYE